MHECTLLSGADVTDHYNDTLPHGANPRYDSIGGAQVVFVIEDGSIQEMTIQDSDPYFTCPLCLSITEQDVERLRKALLDKLPGAHHTTVLRAGLKRGMGVFATRFPT
jgi:hypothetical protein